MGLTEFAQQEPGGGRSRLGPTTRRLLAARLWRSLGQGALVVDLALFLHALGWGGAAIGLVLGAGGLVGACLSLLVGVISDRLRRKPFLLAYELLICVCALGVMLSRSTGVLAAAIALAGFGRGANGGAGPFAPAEQAWLAEGLAPAQRGRVYSLNAAIGFFGMAVGALAAALPPLWAGQMGAAGSFRPLFLLVLLGNTVNLVLLTGAKEKRPTPGTRRRPAPSTAGRRRENGFLWRLVGLNVFNGVAIGLTSPLMAYWFARRFHVGPAAIGPVLAATFAITGLASLIVGRMTRRVGVVRAVVVSRGGGLLLLLLLPLAPVYWLAALLYVLRSAFNRGTAGARQALVVGAVGDERLGLAISLNALSMQLPQAVGPALAGAFIGAGWFATPLYLAAALQGLYVWFYGRMFGRWEASG